jgi:hypothetical protein
MGRLYTIKDLGEAKYFLGIKLERNTHGTLRLSQTNNIENILDRFNMAASRPVPSPMVPSKTLMQRIPRTEEEASAMLGVPYCSTIPLRLIVLNGCMPQKGSSRLRPCGNGRCV